MKKTNPIPRWMRAGRPDEIHAQCLNVQDGIVEACDFDPALCQACETDACKWHPSRLSKGPVDDEIAEEEDDDQPAEEPDPESDEDAGSSEDSETSPDPDEK